MKHRWISFVRRRHVGSHVSATPKARLPSPLIILTAAPSGLRPLHPQLLFPSLSATASTDTRSTQPCKRHISYFCQSQDDSRLPTLGAILPQHQGQISKMPRCPSSGRSQVLLLTLFLSFVPSNSSLLHLGCDTKHHRDS